MFYTIYCIVTKLSSCALFMCYVSKIIIHVIIHLKCNGFLLLASRILGHEAKLRSGHETLNNVVILPDPRQMALADGVIRSWQIFVQVTSPQHTVYLQIWRPQLPQHRCDERRPIYSIVN